MTKLDRKTKNTAVEEQDSAVDEIEIIEIIGMDDDPPVQPITDVEQQDDDEIILDLDEEGSTAVDERGVVEAGSPGEPRGGDEDGAANEQLLRLHADFENFKGRVERERESTRRQATATLVSRLLPVLDNFERAVSTPPSDVGDESLHHGVSLIFRQILDELRKEGLVAIDSVGEIFNPELHEAVATDTESDFPPHTVVEELQRGYLLHDRLLRPSLVRVRVETASHTAPAAGPEDS